MSAYVWLMIVVASIISCHVSRADIQPILSKVYHTTHGDVQGQTQFIEDASGVPVMVDVLQGIPLAKAPVGELRFQYPVEPDNWSGVLQAWKPPHSCVQAFQPNPVIIPNPSTNGSEDCLYVNVYVPNILNLVSAIKPIFVLIHGGFHLSGSITTSLYDPGKLAATTGAIVVFANYRLGAFGYLSLNVTECPGNPALADQGTALQWAKNNAKFLGGNKNRITALALSGGASDLSLVLTSPKYKNISNNAILQSGTGFGAKSYQDVEDAISVANHLAKLVNCTSGTAIDTCRCLKQVPAADLLTAYTNLTIGFRLFFTATKDPQILPLSPIEAYSTGEISKIDTMYGTTRDEGVIALAAVFPGKYDLRQLQPPILSDQDVRDQLQVVVKMYIKETYAANVTQDIINLYAPNGLNSSTNFATLERAITHLTFTCSVRQQAGYFRDASQSVFLYEFRRRPYYTTLPTWTGVPHLMDSAFWLGNRVPDVPKFQRSETVLTKKLQTFLGNFASNNNPTPNSQGSLTWKKYSTSDPGNVLVINEDGSLEVDQTEHKYCDYYSSLPRNYYVR